jgi:rod shape-determining protein MreC
LKNLFRFIFSNIHWLLFFVLLFASLALLVSNNDFQRSRYLSVTHEIAGRVDAVVGTVGTYLRLRSENDRLLGRVAELETQNRIYRMQIETASLPPLVPDSAQPPFQQFRFVPASVVNNSIAQTRNYITINRGSKDGISPDMGALTPQGEVVGIVTSVSDHFAKVMPLLNPKWSMSCKIKTTDFFGSLVWDGRDPRYSWLCDLPSHAVFTAGDTVVASGYSAVFPEGIPVGVVDEAALRSHGGSTALKVRLLADFSRLRHLLVVENLLRIQQKSAEHDDARQKEEGGQP